MKLSPILMSSIIAILAIMACSPKKTVLDTYNTSSQGQEFNSNSHILKITEEIDTFFDSGATYEVLAKNLKQADGPLWLAEQQAILFSQVEENSISIWTPTDGVRTYLSPTGYTDDNPKKMNLGSRGLAYDSEGNLLICQTGDYTISIMAANVSKPVAKYLPLFQRFLKKDMYGPADIDTDDTGNVYFTDPAPIGFDFETKEKWQLPFSGVYAYTRSGKVVLLNDELTVPSGIAVSNDHSYIITSNGDPNKPYWQRTDIDTNLTVVKTGVIYEVPKTEVKAGLPDGLTFHKSSYLFATGPGGIWIFNPKFQLIGKILTSSIATDCTFDNEYTHLYITTQDQLLRIPVK